MQIRLSDTATLFHADCRDAIKSLPDNSVDSVCTDPPYELNFMGKGWDNTGIANDPTLWAEVLRVLKPGGHLAAFSASRTYHRMTCAIEDAGFEIRDSLMWVYGSGMPKSHNLDNKRGELICGCESESPSECDVRSLFNDDVPATEHTSQERGQILQPSVSQSSASVQVLPGASDALGNEMDRPDQSIMEGRRLPPGAEGQLRIDEVRSVPAGITVDGAQGRLRDGTPSGHGAALPLPPDANGMRASSGPRSEKQFACESGTVAEQSQSQDGGAWPCCGRCGKPMVTRGLSTALKPAFEPIVLARKPLSEGTVAANVLRWRTGALNIDGCRIEGEPWTRDNTGGKAEMYDGWGMKPNVKSNASGGRWPANVVHDGSDEVIAAFPAQAGAAAPVTKRNGDKFRNAYGSFKGNVDEAGSTFRGDSGSAARFFYSAKASKADRAGSKHPTVKPVSLMQWLARLITPLGGTVLDPFAGSGTTGAACALESFNVLLCEREAEYVADIRSRFGVPRLDDAQRLREWNAAAIELAKRIPGARLVRA